MNTFGNWLRSHRTDAGMKQSDVAKRAGVSVSYISTLERNQPHSITGATLTPERDKVIAIAKAVGGDVNEALALTNYAPVIPQTLTNPRFVGIAFAIEGLEDVVTDESEMKNMDALIEMLKYEAQLIKEGKRKPGLRPEDEKYLK